MYTRHNKFQYVAVLQGNYGYGWEDELSYNQNNPREMREMKEDFLSYRTNCPMFSFRIVHRRIPTDKWPGTEIGRRGISALLQLTN